VTRPARRRSPVRALLHLPVLLVLLLLLAGCVAIPTDGRVVAGGDVDQPGARPALRVTASGPAEGADEREIVEGFLAAVAGLDDFTVAREFLAPQAGTWRPGEQTVVYENTPTFGPTVRDGATSSVVVRSSVVARIDESGRYVEQEPTPEEQPFELVQVGGQWRIAALPPGVLVSEVDSDRVLAPFGVYFTDTTETYLVPDVRWFPQLTSSATSLVRALLGGPSAPYLGALQSAAPTGTALDLPTVPVENGVATVDLTEEVLLADPAGRAVLLAQLRQTLRAVPTVSDVRVTVDGSPLEEPAEGDAARVPTLVVDPAVDGRLLALAPAETPAAEAAVEGAPTVEGGAVAPPAVDPAPELVLGQDGRPLAPAGSLVQRLGLEVSTPVEGTEALAAEVSTGLAASQDGRAVAGLDAARGSLWLQQQPGAPAVELLTGTGLSAPSFDPPGLSWVWTVGDGDLQGGALPSVLVASASAGSEPGSTAARVEARGGLALGDEVRSLRVSRDGARVLMVVTHLDGTVDVQVRGVRRDRTGRPLSLSQAAFDVGPGLVDAVDAAWVSDDTVVVLGTSGGEAPRPLLVQVGGTARSMAPTPGAVSVTAALGERSIVVGTADGTVLRRSGSLWLDGPFGVSPAHAG